MSGIHKAPGEVQVSRVRPGLVATVPNLKGETMATVYGSHGEIDIDPATGDVIRVRLDPETDDPHYTQILQFDIPEWKRAYPTESELPAAIDILDLGYWYVGPGGGRAYERAEPDARRIIAEGKGKLT